jgi:ketosteroid isomerase-like protein
MRATAEGEVERVLDLMPDDLVFRIAGQPPLRGKAAFAAATSSAAGKFHIDEKPRSRKSSSPAIMSTVGSSFQ